MSAHEDRRANKPQRIPFDGIVELGGASPDGAGFEAQAVDVSLGGMHLRTAYLPDVGQPLLCRFDGGGQEVNAEADVVWRREGTRGGEFGIRFTNLDGPGAEMLMDACGARASSADADGGEGNSEGAAGQRHESKAGPGTRVRLHIDGLGSPMKARVRDAKNGEVMVGSNLEFLRVGRSLELEDVDHKGQKRAAHIDRVEVEIDAASKVPQLVVALRYDDVAADEAGTHETVVRMDVPGGGMGLGLGAGATEVRRSSPALNAAAAAPAQNPMNDDEMQMAAQMKSRFSQAALQVGPALMRFGARAKTTMALLANKAKERSRGGEGAHVRRTTAPPPGGALHAEGKRVVRGEGDEGETATDARGGALGKMTVKRKKALVYGGIGASAVLLLLVATRGGNGSKAAPPGAAGTTTAAAGAEGVQPGAAAATDPGAAANGAAPTAVGADGVTANVPMFGATTLSTTEAVAPPAPGAAAGTPSGFATPGAGNGANAGNGGTTVTFGSGSVADFGHPKSGGDGTEEEARSGSGGSRDEHAKVPPFVHGKVVHPVVLHVRTDGTIESMHAARSVTGFTVSLPGRKASDSGSALSAKDPRIASVHVTNGNKGTELTFQFKDGVPAFALRAKGHDLQVALGRAPAGDDAGESRRSSADRERDNGRDAVHGTTAKKDEGRHGSHKGTR